ncbi:hypothetical protein KOI35_00535 [Actinoplanes bogorensis]|uniref:Uncharacterized protein n=1 Tax=Paractinoplanes bogorensis TaxID=1610840 RepID=A0ABS5YH01_9ACTN|nr:hypothetical protein [Actinoplanes bogorensis]MBU2661983.1 hypothetical protein [Actinoplanes bogorensis]
MLALLEALSPAAGWAGVVIACVVGVLTLYVGATLAVTLFHPNPQRRKHAAQVLRQLLAFLRSTR